MKKTIIICIIIALFSTGCGTIERIERDVQVSASDNNISEEVDKLTVESIEKDKEIKQLKDKIDILSEKINDLEDTNSDITNQLVSTEEIVQTINEFFNGYPDFYIETGKLEDINTYLKGLNTSYLKFNKEINVLDSKINDNIIFITTDFLNLEQEVYIWEQGQTKPILVPNSDFFNGSYKWLIEDEYIILDCGTSEIRDKKIIDVNKKEVISEFKCFNNEYLIPDTTYFILNTPSENTKDELSKDLSVYNFITNKYEVIEKADDLKDWQFNIDESNNKVIIKTYYEENEINYNIEKTIDLDNFVEIYCNTNEENN